MKTLSDILYRNIGHNLYFDLNFIQLENIFKAMREAIHEDRKIIAEHANVEIWEAAGDWHGKIDKDSIFNAPQLNLK